MIELKKGKAVRVYSINKPKLLEAINLAVRWIDDQIAGLNAQKKQLLELGNLVIKEG